MNNKVFYAGYLGFGLRMLAQVRITFKPDMGSRGFYQLTELVHSYIGDPKLFREGCHIAAEDAENNCFGSFELARLHLIEACHATIQEHEQAIIAQCELIAELDKLKEVE